MAARKKTAKPVDAVNLEMIGDKLKVYSLQNLLQAKRGYARVNPPSLGEFLQPWFDRQIKKPCDQLDGITELWMKSLPDALLQNTRLAGLSRGTLQVQVPSGPVRAELDSLLRQGLLQRLQAMSRGAIFKIKTVVDTAAFRPN